MEQLTSKLWREVISQLEFHVYSNSPSIKMVKQAPIKAMERSPKHSFVHNQNQEAESESSLKGTQQKTEESQVVCWEPGTELY